MNIGMRLGGVKCGCSSGRISVIQRIGCGVNGLRNSFSIIIVCARFADRG